MTGAKVGQVAKMLDLKSDRRVQQLVNEGVIPKPIKRGQYDLIACNVAYIRYLNRRLDGKEDLGEGLNLDKERARHAKEQADKLAMENALRRSELVDLSIVGPEWEKQIGATRAKLLSLPTKIAPLVFQAKTEVAAQEVIETALHEAMKDLASGRVTPDTAGDENPKGNGAVRTTAKVDGKPVGGRKKTTKPRVKPGAGSMEH